MKTLLTIDTSADVCSIGLLHQAKLFEKKQCGFKSHATIILSFVDELLSEASILLSDIDLIAFVKGPGSFTGLRIGACVAQGLAVSHDIDVVGISSLQAIAQGAFRRFAAKRVWVINDARMNEVYHAQYEWMDGVMQACGIEYVEALDKLNWNDNYHYIGSGFLLDSTVIPQAVLNKQLCIDAVNPESQDLATLALVQTPQGAELALPSYVRNKVAHKKRETHG